MHATVTIIKDFTECLEMNMRAITKSTSADGVVGNWKSYHVIFVLSRIRKLRWRLLEYKCQHSILNWPEWNLVLSHISSYFLVSFTSQVSYCLTSMLNKLPWARDFYCLGQSNVLVLIHTELTEYGNKLNISLLMCDKIAFIMFIIVGRYHSRSQISK